MMHPATPASAAPTVHLSGSAGVLASIAPILGFHPVDSVVLVCLAGSRRRVGPVIRVDLTGPELSIPAEYGRLLADHAARHADEIVIVTFCDPAAVPDTEPLARALAQACPVLAVVHAPNTPQPIRPELAEAAAMRGRAVLASRQQLAESVTHQPAAVAALQVPTVARLVVELGTVAGRDALIARLMGDAGSVAELVTVAQAVPDTHPVAADACAALAVIAYRYGDGALSQVAVDRCLSISADHRLAHLMLAVMAAGLRPAQLDTLVTTP